MTFLDSLRPGRLAYQLYFRPKAALQAASRRGFLNTWSDNRHHQAMRGAAATLPRPDKTGQPTFRVHFLTGKRFWHQTAFCAWSLSTFGGVNIIPVLHDDGTLSEDTVEPLRRTFSRIEVVSHSDAEARLDQFLPRSRFPVLRARRDVYPNLKKMTDVHVGEKSWKLVLDSDMLFFRRPDAILHWLQSPDRPCHMVDSETSYGYPLDFLGRQCGAPVPELVNVGVTGLCSDQIPWEELEDWAGEQISSYGPHYFQEQALIAQLVARVPPLVLPAADYICQPDANEGRNPTAILHHYVAGSKPAYYRHGWRQCVSRAGRLS